MIYVFGDSHALTFDELEGFTAVPCGSRTAYMLGYHWAKHIRSKLKVCCKGQKIIFLFGEIDCRIQIYWKADGKREEMNYLIDRTAHRYTKFVRKLRSEKWPNIHIMSIFPTGHQNNVHRVPKYGKVRMRTFITERLNFKIAYYCSQFNIPFIDVYPMLIYSSTGKRKKEYIKDPVHLNKKAGKAIAEYLLGEYWNET